MPIHDWTRVDAGIWHAFHVSWISEIQGALNSGLLPSSYYALAEQMAGPMGPDVLTLQTSEASRSSDPEEPGGLLVAVAPPRVRLIDEVEADTYAQKRRTVVIRHVSGDRIVALIELVSPGNKSSRAAVESFVDKAVRSIMHGYHLMVVDLFPPSARDPQGIHGAIWGELGGLPFSIPPAEPLTLVAYSAGAAKRAYIEPTAVGRELTPMPLFLQPEMYINLPLEETYEAAYRKSLPGRWKQVLERRGE